MGQYTQWLGTQEADRRLHAEIETLETELFYVQDRITILEQVVPATENVILRALAAHLEDVTRPVRVMEQFPDLTGSRPGELAGDGSPAPRSGGTHELSEDMLAFFDRKAASDPNISAMLQRERARSEAAWSPFQEDETRRLNTNIDRWFRRWHPEAVAEEDDHDQ